MQVGATMEGKPQYLVNNLCIGLMTPFEEDFSRSADDEAQAVNKERTTSSESILHPEEEGNLFEKCEQTNWAYSHPLESAPAKSKQIA
jgi:hypothetical protein